jgi:NAD-dependent dihydropyrimidine dehydrogenase PreA subunit
MSLVHTITGEHGRIRRWSLYILARYLEMPLMYWGYHLLRGRYRRLGANRLVRAIGSWAVAAPFGYAGDTARSMPAPEVLRLIDELPTLSSEGDHPQAGSIAVGPCRCRAAHKACDHPLETDIVIRTGVEAWTRAFPHEYRLIDREEAKRIVSECSEQGMWPMVFVHCPVHAHRSTQRDEGLPAEGLQRASNVTHGNEYVICNCCTCGCVPYMLNRDLGQRVYPLLRGAYVADTDLDRCAGHGECVEACPFDVRAVVDGKGQLVDACFGCGVCVAACPAQAIQMCRSQGMVAYDE